MSFRNVATDSDSDNDGPSYCKMARDERDVLSMEAEEIKRKHNVWADVVIEQQLDQIGGVHMEDKKSRVDRGCESFVIPAEEGKEFNEKGLKPEKDGIKNEINVPVVTVSPVVDNPFSDAVDLAEVEGFGFDDKPSYASFMKRNAFYAGGRNYKSGERPPNYGGGYKGSFSKHESLNGRENESKRAKSNTQQRAGGNKRNWGGQNILRKIIAPDYSLEALMTTEFDAGLPIEELGDQIGKALGEKDTTTVKKIVVALGEEKALALFELTRQKESEGGVMILDGTRRRAPGGAFIFHFKEDVTIDKEIKDNVFADTEKQDRQWKRAKRRGRRPATFEDSLKKFSDKLKERHGVKDEPEVMEEVDSAENQDDTERLDDINNEHNIQQHKIHVDSEMKDEGNPKASGSLVLDDFMGDEW